MDKHTTILSFKNQDERVIQSIYQQFKPRFSNWLKGRYQIGNPEDCDEIYQRSFTILYFNIKRDKLNDVQASIETYLYGIGKMVIKEWWREKSVENRSVSLEDDEPLKDIDLFTSALSSKSPIADDLRQKLLNALNKLGEPCRTILTLFYWERNSMEAIAKKTGYKNELGAKKKKYLCLVKLKELMGTK